MGCNGDCDCACRGDQAGNEVNGLDSLLNYFDGDHGDLTDGPVDTDGPFDIDCGNERCPLCHPTTATAGYPYGSDVDGLADYDYGLGDYDYDYSGGVVWPTPTDDQVYAAYDEDPCDCPLCEDDDEISDEELIYDRLVEIILNADAEVSLDALVLACRIGYIGTELEV